jgi:hypothetical protein
MRPQLTLLAYAGHVIDRPPNGAQRAPRLWSARGGLVVGKGTQDATTWRINSAGRGRVESGLPMKTKSHFAFRIDI